MKNFQYMNQTKFVFGKGQENAVGDLVKEFGGTNVLIMHYGTNMDFENALINRVIDSVKQAGLDYYDFSGIERAEVEIGDKAVEIVKKNGIDFVLPVGGGAVIDIGKYVAVASVYDGNVWEDLYLNKSHPVPKPIGLGAISTVAASGSENSPDSVMGNRDLKRTMSDSKIRPLFAIMNPELVMTLPRKVTAAGAADIIGHAHERYFSPTPDNYFTDLLNEAAIRTIIKYAPIACSHPDDYNARAQMLWAGLNAHNGQFEVGRNTDRAVHCIESEIGGMYHSVHGMGIGCVSLAWFKYMAKKDLPKFTTYFNRVWGVEMNYADPEGMIDVGIGRYETFLKDLGVPTNFADLGVKEEDIPKLISTTRRMPDGTCGGYSHLTDDDLKHIYLIGLDKE